MVLDSGSGTTRHRAAFQTEGRFSFCPAMMLWDTGGTLAAKTVSGRQAAQLHPAISGHRCLEIKAAAVWEAPSFNDCEDIL